jgi:hypothetical protein
MLYEFATLSFHPLNARKATAGADISRIYANNRDRRLRPSTSTVTVAVPGVG